MKIGRALERRAMRGMDAGVLLAAMLLLGAGATAARAATTLDLAPAADTFIQAGTEAGWDHGLDDHLRVDADIRSRFRRHSVRALARKAMAPLAGRSSQFQLVAGCVHRREMTVPLSPALTVKLLPGTITLVSKLALSATMWWRS